MPKGTLRDIMIYPERQSRLTDFELKKLLDLVNLKYLEEREGGFDAFSDWFEVLSGGEK